MGNHPVVVDPLSKVKADKEDKAAVDTAQVLFQTALIESGYEIADPSALVNRVYRLMSKELGVDPDAPLKEVEVPEGEEEEEEAEEEDKDDSDESDDKEDSDDKEEAKEDLLSHPGISSQTFLKNTRGQYGQSKTMSTRSSD